MKNYKNTVECFEDITTLISQGKRKEAGTSRSKKKSTISPEAYKNMQAGFPKKKKKTILQFVIYFFVDIPDFILRFPITDL